MLEHSRFVENRAMKTLTAALIGMKALYRNDPLESLIADRLAGPHLSHTARADLEKGAVSVSYPEDVFVSLRHRFLKCVTQAV